MDMLLRGHYSKIVFAYNEHMYNTIMRNRRPATLNEWKTRLSEQFGAGGGHQSHEEVGRTLPLQQEPWPLI